MSNPKPARQSVTAHLIVRDAASAIRFYTDAFGAVELFRSHRDGAAVNLDLHIVRVGGDVVVPGGVACTPGIRCNNHISTITFEVSHRRDVDLPGFAAFGGQDEDFKFPHLTANPSIRFLIQKQWDAHKEFG